ncbi:metallophosphoesterase [Deinococcus sp. KSM4-11]|uniref:metallophosphoesterase n=1 Tax=Deinococcus sp. KSM4-11 TaxID=2568654 RepID=UPI0010A489AB|nr:metallophosphoesterase [Deinococcus sp. KSM4-11]THF86212.1 metallophosphoesterase [Deinococcus sp. KSM4-11]
MERVQSLTRRRLLRALAGGGAALMATGGAGVAQAHTLEVTAHTRPLRGLRSALRVAFLSDLHYGLYVGGGQIRRWVDAALAARPDLILLGGDYIDQRLRTSPRPLIRELARLKAPLGVYGVWGNHDYGSFGKFASPYYGPAQADWAARRAQLAQDLGAEGITILRDQGVAVRSDLYIGGVDDLWNGTPDARTALAGAGHLATILLSHNPDVLPDLPVAAGLVLSGHTHGGQVRLPLIGAPVVPSAFGQRYAMGWVQGAHGTPAYVSRGLGTSGIPFRNLCPPELTVLTLTPEA